MIKVHMSSMKYTFCRLIMCLILAFATGLGVFSGLFTVNADIGPEDGGGTPVEIVDPVNEIDAFSAVIYNNTNGLPTSEANAIAQTRDGFIWLGGYSGLIRYDGNTFERMKSNTGVANVVSLLVDKNERLWIGTNDNGVALMENGGYRIWNTDEGMPSVKINALAQDDTGLIYAGTATGIAVIDKDMNLQVIDDARLHGAYVIAMETGTDGIVYGVTNDDAVFSVYNGELTGMLKAEEVGVNGVTYILPDPLRPGNMYIGTDNSGFWYGNPFTDSVLTMIADIYPLNLVLDIDKFNDQIWITARNGIGVLDEAGFHLMDALPMNNNVGHVMTDYEGNIWFTSSRQGVMKIVPNRFIDVLNLNDLADTVVNTTCRYTNGSRDQLFIGADNGLYVVDMEGQVLDVPLAEARTASGVPLDTYNLIELCEGSRIRSVIRDSHNRLWISTFRGCGLVCYDGETATVFNERDGLFTDHIRVVHEADNGDILVVNTGGVSIIRDMQVVKSYGKADGIINQERLTVTSSRSGDILLGTNGDGIYVINESGLRRLTTEDGLSSGIVMRIKRDDKRNLFWIVTSNSIAYMDEDYKITTIKNFPYANNFDMYENDQGEMWVLASDGIYAVSVDELLANEKIDAVHFTLANGLQCTASSNSYSELTKAGDLYMSGTTGVVKVNINAPLDNIFQIKVALPYIEADDQEIYPDTKGVFRIPAGVQKVTIHSNVLSFSLNDLQVSYRLEGFDKHTVTLKRSDLVPIDYTNLPGGQYQFMIHVSDSLGRGNKTVRYSIIKDRTMFEQPWFYLLVTAAGAAALWALVRSILDKKQRAYEKSQAEAVEKERLNTELTTARAIQIGTMPHEYPPFPDRDEFEIYATVEPAREVGGDFYDYYLIDDDHLCLVIADVSGKGIPASLFMMVSKVILQNCAMLGSQPGEILTRTNDAICSNNQADMFVTIWLGILEISTGILTCANAGHEYPAVMKKGKFSLLKDKHGLVIGAMEGFRYNEYEIALEPGDKLFVYTDGVPEGTAADHRMFTTDRLIQALNKDPLAPVDHILGNVQTALDDFVGGAEQFDDVTMLCFEYKGSKK